MWVLKNRSSLRQRNDAGEASRQYPPPRGRKNVVRGCRGRNLGNSRPCGNHRIGVCFTSRPRPWLRVSGLRSEEDGGEVVERSNKRRQEAGCGSPSDGQSLRVGDVEGTFLPDLYHLWSALTSLAAGGVLGAVRQESRRAHAGWRPGVGWTWDWFFPLGSRVCCAFCLLGSWDGPRPCAVGLQCERLV